MAETVSIDIVIENAGGAKTVGELRKAIKDLKTEALGVEVGSKEFVKLTNAAAQAEDKLRDVNEAIGALDPGNKFAQFAKLGATIAGGFQLAQGAAALFGAEGKEIEKTLLKVQAATAVAQGIQSLADAQKTAGLIRNIALQKLSLLEAKAGIVATEGATVAQRLLNLAMASNPAGLLLAGLTALVGVIALYINSTSKSREELEKETKALNENNKAREEQRAALENTRDAYQKEIGALTDRDYQVRQLTRKQNAEIAEARRKLSEDLLAEENQSEEKQKEVRERFHAEEKIRQEKFQLELQTLEQSFIKKRFEKLNDRAKELDAKRKEDSKKDIERERAEEEKRIAANEKATQDHLKHLAKVQEIQQYETDLELKRAQEKEDELLNIATEAQEKQAKVDAMDMQIKQYNLEQEKKIRDAKLSIAQSTLSGLTSLGNILIKDQEKLAKFNKAAALVQIGIDTARAISSLVAASNENPLNGPTGGIAGIAQFAAGIASILVNIAKAKQILGDSGTVSAPTLGGASNISNSSGGNSQPRVIQQTINGVPETDIDPKTGKVKDHSIKVYVTETDITDTVNKVNKIQKGAILGG